MKLSLGIRQVLKLPDVIGVEEDAESGHTANQRPQINADAQAQTGVNPGYTAYLQEGNDISNINVGFLVKSNITVVDVTQYGKDDPITNPTNGNVSKLNDRPSLVLACARRAARQQQFGCFHGHRESPALPGQHRRSRVGSIRPAEAAEAGRVSRQSDSVRQAADPNEKIIAIGDFNAYQFNDGYVDVVGTIKGSRRRQARSCLPAIPW